ncbi:hypothetical protein ES332_D10G140500v1 [Gossypium tomentosum]|uniref:Uncharacterized protein n=1 Tax=Gossypium tomentosum TaxID=34277 RepID=A0A5D2J3M5_GOSTO|nr:hypothetical protein ES332_D10G140500v1 [Gossypium tomentosum]
MKVSAAHRSRPTGGDSRCGMYGGAREGKGLVSSCGG